MGRRDPDDIITALSKNLKGTNAVIRFTFKRGGLWRKEFAKAHSRVERRRVREQVRGEAAGDEEREWPLLVRLRENSKNEEGVKESKRLNCLARPGKGAAFLQSLLSVFRVNFFKKKGETEEKAAKAPTKPNPQSKTSIRNKLRTQRNQQRRKKRQELKKAARIQPQTQKTV